MMLTRRFLFPLLLLLFNACSQSSEEKNHFPINAFLEEELAQIDSLPIAIILTRETNGNADTSVMDKKKFRVLAMQLMGIDFKEYKHKNNYQELVLEDVQLGNISIGYTTEDTDLPIRKIELNIDASSNKIKSIFAERQDKEGEKRARESECEGERGSAGQGQWQRVGRYGLYHVRSDAQDSRRAR
jgi:hypothetical protein